MEYVFTVEVPTGKGKETIPARFRDVLDAATYQQLTRRGVPLGWQAHRMEDWDGAGPYPADRAALVDVPILMGLRDREVLCQILLRDALRDNGATYTVHALRYLTGDTLLGMREARVISLGTTAVLPVVFPCIATEDDADAAPLAGEDLRDLREGRAAGSYSSEDGLRDLDRMKRVYADLRILHLTNSFGGPIRCARSQAFVDDPQKMQPCPVCTTIAEYRDAIEQREAAGTTKRRGRYTIKEQATFDVPGGVDAL